MNTDPQNTLESELKASLKPIYSPEEVLQDYRYGYRSRITSLIGRREVLSGKAKFGIFGDGKELAQMAMAKAFQKGDFRSGYYRDQTFGIIKGMVTIKQIFAQLYADTKLEHEPSSAGRQMNSHMATRLIDEQGNWRSQTDKYLTTSDLSPTAAQMPRLVGLAQASKLYRTIVELEKYTDFSINGNEVAFGTIGNASCAEGHFWETVNAAGVLKVPMVLAIWDDGYGISVTNEYQITKADLTQVLQGFKREGQGPGYEIFTVKGWDYLALCEAFQQAAALARKEHVPSIIHVTELTQPQGHSTSGSHERYKPKERLQFEKDFDCLKIMRKWMLDENIISEEELEAYEKEDKALVRNLKNEAWREYQQPIKAEVNELLALLRAITLHTQQKVKIEQIIDRLRSISEVNRSDYMKAAHQALFILRHEHHPTIEHLKIWRNAQNQACKEYYNTYLFTDSEHSPLKVPEIKPIYSADSPSVRGFDILNRCFDHLLAREPSVVAFGEDLGQLGDVNQAFAGLQKKHGSTRVMDTGIRETTIIGQAIGLALRGFRPIAEIQYLDYLLYGLQTLSDDLASLSYRTRAGQKAPLIIRTRGHRLEGIWHTGSPMSMILGALRGLRVLVPRNMTQAAGMYNTLIAGDEPAILIEVLNAYRLKERLPDNIGEFRIPLGIPEIIRQGQDLTIVTYGACCRIALAAAEQLADCNIQAEVIDVQSLQPFDIQHRILQSLKKTNRIIFMDEDVPGGATAFMMQEVLEKQGGYYYLDGEPKTVSAQAHRAAYGTDGDYWSKPQVEHIFQAAYDLMHDANPKAYPRFY